jgi:hypothetical protein
MELAALPDPLQAAFGSLSGSEQETLYRMTMKMLHDLQESGALPPSRMCVRCKYFEPFRHAQSATPHHCSLVGAPLADRHLRIDCPEHELGEAPRQQALWERFTSGPSGALGQVQQAPGLKQVRTVDHLTVEIEHTGSR